MAYPDGNGTLAARWRVWLLLRKVGSLFEQAQKHEVIFVGGKGGVGKTTTAAALAAQLAGRGWDTLVVSTDPAHSLGDAFKLSLGGEIRAIAPRLSALELDPAGILDEHFRTVEATMRAYARADMMPALRKHLELAKISPGAEEAALLEAICRLLVDFKGKGYERLVFDTAPTGHTVRLLLLPEMMQAWTDGLLAGNRKQAESRAALDRLSDVKSGDDSRLEKARAALQARKALFAAARKMLHEDGDTAFFLVMVPEPLALAETVRTYRRMREFHLPLAGIVVNQVMETHQQDAFWRRRAEREQRVIRELDTVFADCDRYYVLLQAGDIHGLDRLSLFRESSVRMATAGDRCC